MLKIQFGAHWTNKLSKNEVNDKVFAKITQWSKENPALSVLMNDELTPDVELNVLQQGANQEYRIVTTQGSSYIGDLGVTPKQIHARKKSITKSLISYLVLRTDLFNTDKPIKAIIKEMKTSKSLSQQQQIFAGTLASISPSYPVYYRRLINCPPKHVQLPVFEVEGLLNVNLALQPYEVSTSKFHLTSDGNEKFYKFCESLLKKIHTDPAIQYALQESVSPGVKLKVSFIEPGNEHFIEPDENGYPKTDLIANLSLDLTFQDGKTEKISLGKHVNEFGHEQKVVRQKILEAVARHTPDPTKALADLDTFARNHFQYISYIHLVKGAFESLSKVN